MSNLVETVVKSENFQTLAQAAEAINLVEVLKSPGPYTVFAPTDQAFAQLPEGNLNSLLQNLPKLRKILTYHVAFGDVRSDDLRQVDEVMTVEGSIVVIRSDHGKMKVNDATILKTDVLADNGVIHVIDRVLMPAMVAGET